MAAVERSSTLCFRGLTGVLCALFVSSACQESEPSMDADGGAGEGGDSSNSTDAPTGSGASAGSGGRAATGGSGAEAGAGGTSASGGSGSGSGTGGGDGSGTFEHLSLLGPTEANQEPLLLEPELLEGSMGLNIQEMQACEDGGFIAFDGQLLTRFTSSFALDWQIQVFGDVLPLEASHFVTAFTLTPDCSALLGGRTSSGLPDHEYVGSGDAWVAKVNPEGMVEWTHQWGSSASEATEALIEREDGTVLALGSCGGQVPGSPSSSSGFPFSLILDDAGQQVALEQYEQLEGPSATIDLADLFFGGDIVFQVVGDPLLVLTRDWEGMPLESNSPVGVRFDEVDGCGEVKTTATTTIGTHGFHEDSGALYGLTFPQTGPVDPPPPVEPCGDERPVIGGLSKLDFEGGLAWVRSPTLAEEVIDAEEGTTWTGAFSGFRDLLVTAETIFMIGTYSNTYEFGSVVPPATAPTFLAAYDLDGERLWFTEVLIDAQTSRLGLSPVIIMDDGTLLALVRFSAGWYPVALDPDTGASL